ncbi:velvet factor-domain-containing protein [Neurospora tetraspora]|uniref:Velvet factor-domain-containing protein n=1 Tax=Neurospora tetraspora TaxID=94610 RepID=A0AAE0JBK4_9PEZI|nr:velvet factor-domain-containing protein [Neurospora tetraspora]
MSTAVESSHHILGTNPTLNTMSRSLHAHREAYSSRHAHYTPEQQPQQPHLYRQQQQHRLPPVTTIIPTTGPGLVSSSCDPAYRGHSRTYYSDYPTPSPVGQTPPQLPITYNEARSHHGRHLDGRLSPAYSTAASERSTVESTYESRSRQMNHIRDHQVHAEPSWSPFHQQPSRLRQESFSHSTMTRKASAPENNHYGNSNNNSPPPKGSQTPSNSQQGGSPRQESRPMSISNLISTDNTRNTRNPVPPPPSGKKTDYQISVRQQPFAARSCGFGERDRRVIDPPPIVQLTIHNDTLSREELSRLLRHQFSVIHCSIWDETGVKDMSSMPEDFRQQRRLMGTLVASPFVGLDENGEEGCFFCFPDLSCRTPGIFRLKFALVVLDPARMMAGDRSSIVATAMSEPFQVYNAKDFPGMKASTPLTKRLKEQGCLISIKKGNEKGGSGGGGKGEREESGEEDEGRDEEDVEESGRGGGRKGRKRQKRGSL